MFNYYLGRQCCWRLERRVRAILRRRTPRRTAVPAVAAAASRPCDLSTASCTLGRRGFSCWSRRWCWSWSRIRGGIARSLRTNRRRSLSFGSTARPHHPHWFSSALSEAPECTVLGCCSIRFQKRCHHSSNWCSSLGTQSYCSLQKLCKCSKPQRNAEYTNCRIAQASGSTGLAAPNESTPRNPANPHPGKPLNSNSSQMSHSLSSSS